MAVKSTLPSAVLEAWKTAGPYDCCDDIWFDDSGQRVSQVDGNGWLVVSDFYCGAIFCIEGGRIYRVEDPDVSRATPAASA